MFSQISIRLIKDNFLLITHTIARGIASQNTDDIQFVRKPKMSAGYYRIEKRSLFLHKVLTCESSIVVGKPFNMTISLGSSR